MGVNKEMPRCPRSGLTTPCNQGGGGKRVSRHPGLGSSPSFLQPPSLGNATTVSGQSLCFWLAKRDTAGSNGPGPFILTMGPNTEMEHLWSLNVDPFPGQGTQEWGRNKVELNTDLQAVPRSQPVLLLFFGICPDRIDSLFPSQQEGTRGPGALLQP